MDVYEKHFPIQYLNKIFREKKVVQKLNLNRFLKSIQKKFIASIYEPFKAPKTQQIQKSIMSAEDCVKKY